MNGHGLCMKAVNGFTAMDSNLTQPSLREKQPVSAAAENPLNGVVAVNESR